MPAFADKLLAASEDDSLSPAELRAWLRRAALRLREQEAGNALDRLTAVNDILARQGRPLLELDVVLTSLDEKEAKGSG